MFDVGHKDDYLGLVLLLVTCTLRVCDATGNRVVEYFSLSLKTPFKGRDTLNGAPTMTVPVPYVLRRV